MDSSLVTIIIPIFKSANYLAKCLNSVVNQTLKEIEIILVNDASPDPMDHKICEEYKANDARIKYIVHEKNTGQGGARNTGIMNASSEYVGFVDSDDWIELDMFQKLLSAIQKEKADVSQCYFLEHNGSKINTRRLKKFRKQRDFINATNVLVWNKLFKKSLFTSNNIFFPEGHSHEDTATLPRLMYFVHSIAQVKEPLYHYLVTRKGATTTNYGRIFNDHSVVFSSIKSFMMDMEVWDSHRVYFEKRIIRSLLHDISRLIKDNSLQEVEKQQLIKAGLEKTINLLKHPHKITRSSLKETKKSLGKYKQKLILKQLI